MLIVSLFCLAFVLYSLTVWGMYTPSIRGHEWYVPGSMLLSASFSWVWPLIVRLTPTAEDIYVRAMLWDAILIFCFAFLPYLFGVELSTKVVLGGAITVTGLIIMKLG